VQDNTWCVSRHKIISSLRKHAVLLKRSIQYHMIKIKYKRNYLRNGVLAGLFILLLVLCYSSFSLPWSLIDDAEDLSHVKQITNYLSLGKFKKALLPHIDLQVGRIRPIYWICRSIYYECLGLNPTLHHLLQYLVFSATVYLLFNLTLEITSSQKSAFLSGLFFILFPPNMKNYYRLGPQESFQVLFIASSLFFLIKAQKTMGAKKRDYFKFYLALSLFSLPLAYLTKETTIVLVPVSLFMLVIMYSKQNNPENKLFLGYFLANLVCGIGLGALALFFTAKGDFFLTAEKAGDSYASYYQIKLPTIWNSLKYYKAIFFREHNFNLLVILSGVTYLTYFISGLRGKKTLEPRLRWELIVIVYSLGFLLIILPWPFRIGRYLLPFMFGTAIFMGIGIEYLWGSIERLSYRWTQIAARASLIVIICLFSLLNGLDIYSVNQCYLASQTANTEMIRCLATCTPPGGNVFMNMRVVWYIKNHLSFFYNRPDITVKPLLLKPTEGYRKGDIIVTNPQRELSPEVLLRKYFREKLEEEKVVQVTGINYDFYDFNFSGLIKDLIKGKLSPDFQKYSPTESVFIWKIFRLR